MTRTSAAILLVTVLISDACDRSTTEHWTAGVSAAQAQAISRDVETALRNAYDLSKPGAVQRMLSLYPASGRVISASGGQVMTSRDSLAAGINTFWNSIGRNMREPHWIWDHFYVDVLSPTAAVVTATYHVPHLTPRNTPHVIGGAMTEIFQRRGNRWVVIQEHLSDLPAAQHDSTMPGM